MQDSIFESFQATDYTQFETLTWEFEQHTDKDHDICWRKAFLGVQNLAFHLERFVMKKDFENSADEEKYLDTELTKQNHYLPDTYNY